MPKKVVKKTAVTKKTAKKAARPKKSKVKAKSKLPKKVVTYLTKAGVPHEMLEHKTVYTAYDAAQTMGKKINEIAKSLLVKADKDYYVVLLPADQNIDFDKLGKQVSKLKGKDIKAVKIPGEKIMNDLLRLKNETLSAFGTLHKLPVVADKSLTKLKKVIFSSGSLNHSVEMKVRDYLDLEKAELANFAVKKKLKKVKTSLQKKTSTATKVKKRK